jgi:hypothetical protein
MKTDNEKAKELVSLSKLKINVTAEIDALSTVFDILDKTTPDAFFRVLGIRYVNDKLCYATTMMKFLAQQEDADKLEFGVICLYVANHYKDLTKIAFEDLGKRMKEANKKP